LTGSALNLFGCSSAIYEALFLERPNRFVVRHRGVIVPLRSVQANDLAEKIILPRLFPNLGKMQREVTLGKSRPVATGRREFSLSS
jgi:DNA-binding sugar fermentation-stimulating protein